MIRTLKNILRPLLRKFRSKHSRPIYLEKSPPGLKIHLGSGDVNLQGWVNIDARPSAHIHLQSIDFHLNEFSDTSISEIYLCHVLEHFDFDEGVALLTNLKNKLISGGCLRISVPDFDQLIQVYESGGRDLKKIQYALMGGQDYEYNFHRSVFNRESLSELLERLEFRVIKHWDSREDFGVSIGDWSEGKFDTPQGAIPISLNLKAYK